jgi:hypothetical protein
MRPFVQPHRLKCSVHFCVFPCSLQAPPIPSHPILLHSVTQIIFCEVYDLGSFSVRKFLQSRVTPLAPFSDTLRLCEVSGSHHGYRLVVSKGPTVSIFRIIDAGNRLLRNFRTHLPKSCNTPVSVFNLCCSLGAQTKFPT